MLKKLRALSSSESRLRPLFSAIDAFIAEKLIRTRSGPVIRDGLDIKRVMMLVFFALVPCTVMAVWNSGLTGFVYGTPEVYGAYVEASKSLGGYFAFGWQHLGAVVWGGLWAFVPVLIVSYAAGGFWEVLFACVRGHEVSEGFLVTGILIALIMPPTIPLWMVAVGASFGVVIGKELFGGTGMNILNPALAARAFLYFSYPNKLTGDIWVTKYVPVDGSTQATFLGVLNANDAVKRIHVDALAGKSSMAAEKFSVWSSNGGTIEQFVTTPLSEGGLGLGAEFLSEAQGLAQLKYSEGLWTDGNFFFGNMLGSFGETSVLAVLLGVALLLVTRIASWRTFVAVGLGAWVMALLFQLGSHLGVDGGAWNPARFDIPAYKHLLVGGLAFGAAFMATEPVTSPTMSAAKWIYGLLIGGMTVVIRLINPAFPEGIMLAILFGNVFAPLFDRIALKSYRRFRHVKTA